MCGFGYWDGFYSPLGALFNIIIFGLVICMIAYLFNKSSDDSKEKDAAMYILRKRYAAGEINAEEFAQKKRDLES